MCSKDHQHVHCTIIPPDILRNIADSGNAQQKELAFRAISISGQMRGRRDAINNIAIAGAIPTGTKRRTVFDARHLRQLPGVIVRGEGSPATSP